MRNIESTDKVLVVDDEQIVIDSAEKILSIANIQISTAIDAAQALEILENEEYELLVTDIMLPNMSGLELLTVVKEKYPFLPVICFSGYATLEKSLESFKKGAFDFLPKPFQIEELLSVVTRALHYRKISEEDGFKNFWQDTRAAAKDDQKYYYLSEHTWALVEQDGSAKIGLAETFHGLSGMVSKIRCRAKESIIDQGEIFAWLDTDDEIFHQISSPLGGRILEVNSRLISETALIDKDPLGEGWLVRILPVNLETEIKELDLR
jgi:FixJ family two-component response regulator/glycine cleavage system H lipoate-binding protein